MTQCQDPSTPLPTTPSELPGSAHMQSKGGDAGGCVTGMAAMSSCKHDSGTQLRTTLFIMGASFTFAILATGLAWQARNSMGFSIDVFAFVAPRGAVTRGYH